MDAVSRNGSVWCEQRLAGMAAERCIEFQDKGICRCARGPRIRVEWRGLNRPVAEILNLIMCKVCGQHPMRVKSTGECGSCAQARYRKTAPYHEPCSECRIQPVRYTKSGLCGRCYQKRRYRSLKQTHLKLVGGGYGHVDTRR